IVDGPRDKSLHGAPAADWSIPLHSARGDSLTLWIADSAVYRTDSLRLSVRYMKPDSLERLVWTTDTLRFFFRDPKRSKKEIEADTLPPRFDTLPVTLASGTTQEVYKPLRFTTGQPLKSIDTAKIHFEMKVDTNWVAKPFAITADSLQPVLTRRIDQRWEPGAKYRLSIDSAAIHSIYGEHNKAFTQEFAVRALEDYSNLTVRLVGADSTAVVELLSTSGDSVRTAQASVDGRAVFKYVQPGTYYLRMFFDTDGNGRWTTGRLDSIQPEEVAYYPKKIELKRNWDVEQHWDIYEFPVDRQKPYALLKNKPKLKRGEKAPDSDDDTTEEDEFMGSGYRDDRYNNGNDRYNRNKNNSLNTGGFGGFREMPGNLRR
ncbi:MAG: carboxypeptidase-like regulatory domain-containing protein, partial [Muribaculaceae bacterium]|nr:carboxypeptidase-like regulatory domain-containing protein [Muribaculaceae bacterium]